MMQGRETQVHRILSMYDRLKSGHMLFKKEEAARYSISEKSVQRDINTIRIFLETEKTNENLDYNRLKRVYVLETK